MLVLVALIKIILLFIVRSAISYLPCAYAGLSLGLGGSRSRNISAFTSSIHMTMKAHDTSLP